MLTSYISRPNISLSCGQETQTLSTGAAEAPPPETLVLVHKDCSKCQKRFAQDELYKKSANRYLCGNCNKLSTFLCRLDLPDNFRQLNSNQLCEFYNSVSKMTSEDGKLCLHKVSTQVQLALEMSVENSSSSSLGGEFLPLSVLTMQGWDPALVQSAGIRRDDPKLGVVYKMEVLSEKVEEKQAVKRKEGTTVNLRAKKAKGGPQEEAPQLVSSDEEEGGPESKETRKNKKAAEKLRLKAARRDAALASKTVSALAPLLLQVKDEEKKKKAGDLVQEATAFLEKRAGRDSLSYAAAHLETEVALLKGELQPKAAPKRPKAKGKSKAAAKAGEGNE